MVSFASADLLFVYQVKLNVGGSVFMTSRETLMRDSNSMLARWDFGVFGDSTRFEWIFLSGWSVTTKISFRIPTRLALIWSTEVNKWNNVWDFWSNSLSPLRSEIFLNHFELSPAWQVHSRLRFISRGCARRGRVLQYHPLNCFGQSAHSVEGSGNRRWQQTTSLQSSAMSRERANSRKQTWQVLWWHNSRSLF